MIPESYGVWTIIYAQPEKSFKSCKALYRKKEKEKKESAYKPRAFNFYILLEKAEI